MMGTEGDGTSLVNDTFLVECFHKFPLISHTSLYKGSKSHPLTCLLLALTFNPMTLPPVSFPQLLYSIKIQLVSVFLSSESSPVERAIVKHEKGEEHEGWLYGCKNKQRKQQKLANHIACK